MANFDVLNEFGQMIGQKKSREEVHREGDWHKTVHVWIINSSGSLLIQKRSPQKDSHPDMWDISCAGHISAGENGIDAAIREVKEELGVNLSKEDFQYLFTVQHESILKRGAFINREFNEVYLVKHDFQFSEFQIQQDELTEVKFIPYLELERMIKAEDKSFVPHKEECRKLFAYLKKEPVSSGAAAEAKTDSGK